MNRSTAAAPRYRQLLRISPAVQHAIVVDCAERAPLEACGGLIGRFGASIEAATAHPLPNRAVPGHTEYLIASSDVKRLDDAARAQDLEVIGFYHSHPQSAPVPSPRDIESAWPGYVYVIVGTDAGAPYLMGWRLRDDRTGFDPVEVECRS